MVDIFFGCDYASFAALAVVRLYLASGGYYVVNHLHQFI